MAFVEGGGSFPNHMFTISLQYCGNGTEFEEKVNSLKNNSDSGFNKEIDFGYDLNWAQHVVNGGKDVLDTVFDFTGNFEKNQFGTLATLTLDIILNVIGDTIQSIANMVQTVRDGTFLDKDTVTYKYSYLLKDGAGDTEGRGAGNRDKYTKVSTYEPGAHKDWQRVIDIKKDNEDGITFKAGTKIPVMYGDVYNIAVNHLTFFDVNFFENADDTDENSTNQNGNNNTLVQATEDKVLKVFKNFTSSTVRISIYVASVLLITMLIIYAVQIVGHTFDNPQKQKEPKEGLERFVKSVVMLVGSVLIMALCIYGSKSLENLIEVPDTEELPIRVNVEETGYSFSTTATGYVRYMASIEDVDRYAEKTFYVLGYLFLAFINLLAVIMMYCRMFGLWILSILGPIIATVNVFGKKGPISYKTWVELYIGLSVIHIAVIFGYDVVLNYFIY